MINRLLFVGVSLSTGYPPLWAETPHQYTGSITPGSMEGDVREILQPQAVNSPQCTAINCVREFALNEQVHLPEPSSLTRACLPGCLSLSLSLSVSVCLTVLFLTLFASLVLWLLVAVLCCFSFSLDKPKAAVPPRRPPPACRHALPHTNTPPAPGSRTRLGQRWGTLIWWRFGVVSHLPSTRTRGAHPSATNPTHQPRVGKMTGVQNAGKAADSHGDVLIELQVEPGDSDAGLVGPVAEVLS